MESLYALYAGCVRLTFTIKTATGAITTQKIIRLYVGLTIQRLRTVFTLEERKTHVASRVAKTLVMAVDIVKGIIEFSALTFHLHQIRGSRRKR